MSSPRTGTSRASTIRRTTTDPSAALRRMSFFQKIFAALGLVVVGLAAATGGIALELGARRIRAEIEKDFAAAEGVFRARILESYRALTEEVETWADDKRYAAWLGRASDGDAVGGAAAPADLQAAHDGLIEVVYKR